MIIYLHGFRSSPQSFKAQMMAARMHALGLQEKWWCPQLPASPVAAMEMVAQRAATYPADSLTIVGSSLGGYYATWLAEQFGCKAVLLNPAVHAARDLVTQVGVTEAYHSATPFIFTQDDVDALKRYHVATITRPERYFLLAATGDEVLDWREMATHFVGARQTIIEGSDHGISDFATYVDAVLGFCGAEGSAHAGAPV